LLARRRGAGGAAVGGAGAEARRLVRRLRAREPGPRGQERCHRAAEATQAGRAGRQGWGNGPRTRTVTVVTSSTTASPPACRYIVLT